jgi:hypothetical protein
MLTVSGGGVKVRVRREIAPLVQTLLAATVLMGYRLKVGACWGFANRPIRGTKTASNHSWGLAVDVNSEDNPMGSKLITDLPPKVVHAWESCHFYWGGRYENRPDAMHFEYVGRPQDVAADLKRARALLASLTKPPTGGSAEGNMADWTEAELRRIYQAEEEEYAKRFWVAPTGTGTALIKVIRDMKQQLDRIEGDTQQIQKTQELMKTLDDNVATLAAAPGSSGLQDSK